MIDAAGVRRWLFEQALPAWAKAGLDPAGGFAESLGLDGRPQPGGVQRMRVQARQIYVYCHAFIDGWPGPARAAADAGFKHLTERFWHPDGGFVFSLGADGKVANDRRESYEQAFALLAFASHHRAFGGAASLDWARRTLDFLDTRLAAANGGYRESLPDALPRRQNPHMHLMEALMALFEATGEADYLKRAGALVALMRRHFIDPASGTLGEFFSEDWAPAPGDEGTHLEPGHHYEWTWLLHQYAGLSGDREAARAAHPLYRFAVVKGTDPVDGLAYDVVGRDGGARQGSKRLWVQTEALKAHLAMAEQTADTAALGRAQATLDAIFARYLATGHGVWQDQFAADGRPMAASAPASSFYHLYLAFSEYQRVCALA